MSFPRVIWAENIEASLHLKSIYDAFHGCLFSPCERKPSSFEGLSHIASAIGKPLYANELTEKCKRLSFAKICVEVDVSSELLTTVEVVNARGESCDISVKYPWKPSKCSSCQVFGHSDNGCPKRVREAVGTREPQPTQTSNTPPLTNVLRREAPSVVPIVIGLQGQS